MLTGPKVRSFFDNINDPTDTREVTIDGHMAKMFNAAADSEIPKTGGFPSRDSLMAGGSDKAETAFASTGYIAGAEAVHAVATEWGVTPDVVQAAYWIQVRDTDWEEMRS